MKREEIEQIEALVIEYCTEYNVATGMVDNQTGMPINDVWENHISLVRNNAVEMAKERGADVEVCELSALLHDIAALADHEKNRENHHITGSEMAEDILREYNYPEERLELVKKCILNHRGSVPCEKHSLEEVTIAEADAMAHLQKPESLLKLRLTVTNNLGKATLWVREKLAKSYNKMSEYAQEKCKSRYNDVMHIYCGEEV